MKLNGSLVAEQLIEPLVEDSLITTLETDTLVETVDPPNNIRGRT